MQIKQDDHHMNIKGHRGSGRARLLGLAGAMVLILTALYVTPAHAGAPFAKCDGLKLTKASGVPGGSVHNYAFEGTCWMEDYASDKKKVEGGAAAVASARWDRDSHTYTEHTHLMNGTDLQKITSSSTLFSSSTHVNKGSHVGTGAEDASFRCLKDPVINASPSCTLVSHSNATGWGGQGSGFDYYAGALGAPLLGGLATRNEAAVLSKHNPLISCKGLHLAAASGVPNGKYHTYKFSGTCNLYQSLDGNGGLQVTRVLANGKWNAVAQQAEEGVTVLTAPNKGGGGWSTKYTCTADPWLHPHAKCSRTSQLGKTPRVYDPITDILNRHPITMGRVNSKLAAQLSSKSHHKKSPAHHETKLGPSVVNHHVDASKTKSLHLSSPHQSQSRIAPNIMRVHSASSPVKPNVRVLGEKNIVDKNCRDPHRLIVVDAMVRNDGGPLAAHQWSLYIKESNGAVLSSGTVWVPPLASHARATVPVPVSVSKNRIAQLPGKHWLNLVSQGTGQKSTTLLQPFTFGPGTCQPKLHASAPVQKGIQP